jgi:hypothetical protein
VQDRAAIEKEARDNADRFLAWQTAQRRGNGH